MELTDKSTALNKLAAIVHECSKCALSRTRTNAVPGEGNPESQLMFVGEAPGAREDDQGIPFCGPAGKFLEELLASINLNRSKVFIANTVKCRPPANRDPEDSEKDACWPYLEEQIKIINPKIIICLGRHSLSRLLPGAGSISKIHGQPMRRPDGRIYLPLYHPSAALHNGSLRGVQLKDFQRIPIIIEKINNQNQKEATRNQKQQKLL